MNVAPRLSTCSRTTGRTSKPATTAPRRRAVAIACRPATPAPTTSTFAGATVPAAVISIGKKRGSRSAAISTALYPETVACEESASIGCARVVRGIDSIAKPYTPWSASRSIPAASVSGSRNPIRIWPLRSRAASSALGLRTFATASASQTASASVAPASRYASSGNEASAPASGSTTTSNPAPAKRVTASGTSATRRSPGSSSRGTPMRTQRSYVAWMTGDPLHRALRALVPVRDRVPRERGPLAAGGDRPDHRGGAGGRASSLDRGRDRGRRGRRDHRRQHRLLDRPQGRAAAPLSLRANPSPHGARLTSGGALLRTTRRQGCLPRTLLRRAPRHRCVDGGHHGDVLVALPLLERRGRNRLGIRRGPARVLRRQGGGRRARPLRRVRGDRGRARGRGGRGRRARVAAADRRGERVRAIAALALLAALELPSAQAAGG